MTPPLTAAPALARSAVPLVLLLLLLALARAPCWRGEAACCVLGLLALLALPLLLLLWQQRLCCGQSARWHSCM
jgi:hypothetical protein